MNGISILINDFRVMLVDHAVFEGLFGNAGRWFAGCGAIMVHFMALLADDIVSKPLFGAQFHPEASPGPDDTEFVFDILV